VGCLPGYFRAGQREKVLASDKRSVEDSDVSCIAMLDYMVGAIASSVVFFFYGNWQAPCPFIKKEQQNRVQHRPQRKERLGTGQTHKRRKKITAAARSRPDKKSQEPQTPIENYTKGNSTTG
jgi:hypothetical protein